VLHRFAVDRGQGLGKRQPLHDGVPDLAAVLEHPPKINVGRIKVLLNSEAFAKGIDGAWAVTSRVKFGPRN
jgi:hypothetical protein